jgi:hypothetical protein
MADIRDVAIGRHRDKGVFQMKEKRILRTLLAMAVSGTFSAGAFGQVVIQEIEPNSTLTADGTQRISSSIGDNTCVEIRGFLGDPSVNAKTGPFQAGADYLDFYSFHASNGDTLTIDIDDGIKGFDGDHVDTWIGLFRPDNSLRDFNDNRGPRTTTDTGSVTWQQQGWKDARLGVTPGDASGTPGEPPVLLDATGTWTVGVSSTFRPLTTNGTYAAQLPMTDQAYGSYILRICGLKQQPLELVIIQIDVKPGSTQDAPVNPKAKGVIPVALLGSSTFNPFEIEAESLRFGAAGNEASWRRCSKDAEDVNRDGFPDRVCHFDNQAAGFDEYDDRGILKGKLSKAKGGVPFEGSARLKVITKTP